jgi:Zn-dependent protease
MAAHRARAPDGFRLFSVRGIPIRLHWTFFLILPWLAFGMARPFATFAASAHTAREALLLPPAAWGLLLAVLLFVSVLLHELGHVFVARAQGSPVSGVTLMLLGGVSHIDKVSRERHAEAKMALVGPVVSLGLAGLAYLGHRLVRGPWADLEFGLYYLAQMNLAIAVFNLVPAFPLDGGRVLRSLLEPGRGRARATELAVAVGRVLAIAMGVFGAVSSNVLLVLVAVFVWGGGAAEAASALRQERLTNVRVSDVTDTNVPVLAGSSSVEEAAEVMLSTRVAAVVVRGREGEVGLVGAVDVAAVPEPERLRTPLASIAHFDLPVAQASDPAAEALEAMVERNLPFALVVGAGGWLRGVLSREGLLRRVSLESTLHRGRPSTA